MQNNVRTSVILVSTLIFLPLQVTGNPGMTYEDYLQIRPIPPAVVDTEQKEVTIVRWPGTEASNVVGYRLYQLCENSLTLKQIIPVQEQNESQWTSQAINEMPVAQ
jgi:hypothetical protein